MSKNQKSTNFQQDPPHPLLILLRVFHHCLINWLWDSHELVNNTARQDHPRPTTTQAKEALNGPSALQSQHLRRSPSTPPRFYEVSTEQRAGPAM